MVLMRLRQEAHHRFKASLSYTASVRQRELNSKTVSKATKQNKTKHAYNFPNVQRLSDHVHAAA